MAETGSEMIMNLFIKLMMEKQKPNKKEEDENA